MSRPPDPEEPLEVEDLESSAPQTDKPTTAATPIPAVTTEDEPTTT